MTDRFEKKLPEIISQLRSVNPDRVYLFGSLANSQSETAGDIDIAVVLNTAQEPKNFEERLALKVTVRNAIFAVSQEVPIDLVVYTKDEFERLQERNWPFIREILEGQLLYEKAG